MGIVRNKLFENPDFIVDEKDNRYTYGNSKYMPIPFGFYDGKLFIDKEGRGIMHAELPGWSEIEKEIKCDNTRYCKSRVLLQYSGRLWKVPKLISFWKYPPKEKFKEIIDEIGEAIGEPNMYNNPEWRVEIVTSKKTNHVGKEVKDVKDNWDWDENNYETKLIPLKNYAGSNQRSKEELAKAHVASPIEKSKMKRPGRSQFFKVRDSKEKPLTWKQALVKSESMIVKDRINESPDNFDIAFPGGSIKNVYYGDDEFKQKPFAFWWRDMDPNKLAQQEDWIRDAYDTKAGDFWLGEWGEGHGSDCPKSTLGALTGRIWPDLKVISLWWSPQRMTGEMKDLTSKVFNELLNKLKSYGYDVRNWKWDPWNWEEGRRYFEYGEMATIKDFVKYLNVDPSSINLEKLRKQEELDFQNHLKSPGDRTKKKKRIPGFGSDKYAKEKPLAWRQAMSTSESLIKESPDNFTDEDGNYIEWDMVEYDPVTFAWYDGKLYATGEKLDRSNPNYGNVGNKDFRVPVHFEFAKIFDLKDEDGDRRTYIGRGHFTWPGRLWKKKKMISFWEHPPKDKMNKALKEIDDKVGTNILSDPEWKIEIYDEDDRKWKKIPVTKYTGSDRVSSKELAQQHAMSPMLKKPNISGPGKMRSKTYPGKIPAKTRADITKYAYTESKKEIVKSSLFESPDGIEADNLYDITGEEDLSFYGRQAIPFGYYEGKMRVGKENEVHGDIYKRYDDMNARVDRYSFKYGGRAWPMYKVISFWNYPPSHEFKKVLNDIQEENRRKYSDSNYIDFSDPNWSIEVITKKLPIKGEVRQEWDAAEDATLIPFSKYVGSEDQSAEAQAQAHVKSPIFKQRKPKDSAFFKVRDSKEKPLTWKQALMKSESLSEQALNEKLLIGEPISVPELRDLLHKKVINFEFIKLDGEVRPAKGTTMMKYIPGDQQPTGENPSSDKVAAFYDLSKGEWRSVSNRSDEIVLKRDPETGKPKIVVSDKKPKEEPTKPSMPKEKDVEQRPITPKPEPVVRPSVRPETVQPIPKPEEIEEPEKEEPLNIEDPNIQADEVEPEEIIAPEQEEVPQIEEPEEPSQDYDEEKDVSASTISKEDITFPPDEEDITFPKDEEEEDES
jgi:hypothetical protein